MCFIEVLGFCYAFRDQLERHLHFVLLLKIICSLVILILLTLITNSFVRSRDIVLLFEEHEAERLKLLFLLFRFLLRHLLLLW